MVNVRFHENEYEEVFVQILFDAGWKYTPGSELTGDLSPMLSMSQTFARI